MYIAIIGYRQGIISSHMPLQLGGVRYVLLRSTWIRISNIVYVGTNLGLFPPAQESSRPAVAETAAKWAAPPGRSTPESATQHTEVT